MVPSQTFPDLHHHRWMAFVKNPKTVINDFTIAFVRNLCMMHLFFLCEENKANGWLSLTHTHTIQYDSVLKFSCASCKTRNHLCARFDVYMIFLFWLAQTHQYTRTQQEIHFHDFRCFILKVKNAKNAVSDSARFKCSQQTRQMGRM